MSERKYTPKVIHVATSKGRVCGKPDEGSWTEKSLSDEFAQSLPPCPDCVDELYNRGWKMPDNWNETRTQTKPDLRNLLQSTTFPPEPLVVEQSGGVLQSSEQMSLREWCV